MLKLKLVIVVSFTVLLLALTGCRGMVAPPEATTLTVMTYNIYVGTEVADIFTIATRLWFPRKSTGCPQTWWHQTFRDAQLQ